jgi:tRNA A-37 threonylcarbamoyl transferase component Bud32
VWLPEQHAAIPGFRLEREIGRGGMGVVYEATQLTLNRRVAIKLLSPELADDAALRTRFRREALFQAAIDHPHVLDVYETGVCELGLFIVMRLIRGETLTAMLRRGRMDPREAVDLLWPVADALDAAHACGIVHRDVKPGNILIGPRRHAYLADFGLVRAAGQSRLTRPGVAVGTLGYVPPEQLQGAEPSPAGDVYSFAAVLRECVGGRGQRTPNRLDDVLGRGLAYDPGARPRLASELMTLAEGALRPRPKTENKPVVRPPKPPAHSPLVGRLIAAAVSIACITALASLGGTLLRDARSGPPHGRLGAEIRAPMMTAMSAADFRLGGYPVDAAPTAWGLAVEFNVSLQGYQRVLQLICEVRDLEAHEVSEVARILVTMRPEVATLALSCWLPMAVIRGHHYRATIRLWIPGASFAPLATRSATFAG